MRKHMNLIGKTSINPFIFYSGKISGYITWIIFIFSILNVINISIYSSDILKYTSYVTFVIGLIFSILSLINLGKSTRLGLPSEDTILKLTGIYKISRNPMYIGFDLFTISSMLYTLNPLIIIAGIYSIFVYHSIIIGEETFLEKRFGKAYNEYRNKVRRYL
jgi:protein-S-isoprenylcysteine O-methyltransferase Ste14